METNKIKLLWLFKMRIWTLQQGKLAGDEMHTHTGVHMPDPAALPQGCLPCSPAAPWGCGITPAPGAGTVQPSCSSALLSSRWWEKPETPVPLPLRNHQTLSWEHPTETLAASSGSVREGRWDFEKHQIWLRLDLLPCGSALLEGTARAGGHCPQSLLQSERSPSQAAATEVLHITTLGLHSDHKSL